MGNSAAKDTEEYREGYPGKVDDQNATQNLQFYKNLLRSRPNGGLIDDIHRDWFGNYRLLEQHHGYIQWLFPIREHGMNSDAQVLQLHEAQAIMADDVCKLRVVRSYSLMLDFYGMRLKNNETGEVERADNWRHRYSNLNHSSHNWLRVTRIMKSLGELGFEHYKLPFLLHVAHEVFETRELAPCKTSLLNYWCMVLRNPEAQLAMNTCVRQHAPERSLSYMASVPVRDQSVVQQLQEEGPGDNDDDVIQEDEDEASHERGTDL